MWALLILLVVVGLVIMIITLINRRKHEQEPEVKFEIDEECCGAHEVCDRDSLLNKDCEIVYYDDEELDILSGKPALNYTKKEVEEISDIFYTLQEKDVAGWLKSLQLRNIELPSDIREQAILIVSERRNNNIQTVIS